MAVCRIKIFGSALKNLGILFERNKYSTQLPSTMFNSITIYLFVRHCIISISRSTCSHAVFTLLYEWQLGQPVLRDYSNALRKSKCEKLLVKREKKGDGEGAGLSNFHPG